VLSLYQYLRTNDFVEPSDPQIVALSELLQRLPLERGDVDRGPDAILEMLQRWRGIDLYYEEEPVPPLLGTAREQAVWERFVTKPDGDAGDVDATAARISAIADESSEPLPPVDDEAEAVEGRLLFRQHRARERDPEITRLKKAAAMEQSGRLECEVCGFDFANSYGQLGHGFIECHHRAPLSATGERTTRLADLALVCPNCHRILHRSSQALTVEALKEVVERG
jgi:5-methylcytosine-specific restriction protein A